MSSRPRRLATCVRVFSCLVLATALCAPRAAHAEKVLVKGDNWEVYSDGRVGAFLSYVFGDGAPVPIAMVPQSMGGIKADIVANGGWAVTVRNDVDMTQGKVSMMRVRSGFIGNQLGFGVRTDVLPGLKATTYIQLWSYIESENRNKGFPNPVDVRQGYAKLEGPWGSFLAGRTRTLFSRGATDINALYAHRWGVGFPNAVDSKGPTQGMVGFGVMGSGFAAGLIYGTPVLAGFQLNVGLFDPTALAAGGWTGTEFARPEAELTYEHNFGSFAKLVLFGNGTYQSVYKPGYCPPPAQSGEPCEANAAGVGYGGRLELGPFHLGLAGHYGKGLGLNYALEQSYAAMDPKNNPRTFDGYYAQTQLVLSKFDFFAGAGIARVFLTPVDKALPENSNIKYQTGINGGVVYNLSPNVHLDLEYFRAQAKWWYGEQQTLNSISSGMTVNW
jgi:hypothetical protein